MHREPQRHDVRGHEREVFLLAQQPAHGALDVRPVLGQQVGLQRRHPAGAQGEAHDTADADVLAGRHARARQRDGGQTHREHHHGAESQRDGAVPTDIVLHIYIHKTIRGVKLAKWVIHNRCSIFILAKYDLVYILYTYI